LGSPISSSASAAATTPALAQPLQYHPVDGRGDLDVGPAAGRRLQPGPGQLQLVFGPADGKLRGPRRFIGRGDRRLRRLEIVTRNQAGIGQRLLAHQRGAGARQAGRGPAAFRLCLTDRRARGVDGRAQLRTRARIQERRFLGHHPHQHGHAAPHLVSGFRLDARDAPGHRGRDDEALAHARLALLVDGDLHRALRRGHDIDHHRLRPERGRRDGGDNGDGQEQARALQEAHHSRILSTATRSS
jgi:hypothetical protein